MICLGHTDEQKSTVVAEYRQRHGIDKVFVISPAVFATFAAPSAEIIEYLQVIKYKVFYRLLQEIDDRTLIVVNECLRTQNRHELSYNCIRQYLNQTPHSIVFQYLPIIEQLQDFMILVDFSTKSRWKREQFSPSVLDGVEISVESVEPEFIEIPVGVSAAVKRQYQAEKRKLIDHIGLKDPHTIPRNLYLVGGKAKAAAVDPERRYIARNTRLKRPNIVTWREDRYHGDHAVLEFCHNAIDLVDFLTASRQRRVEVLVADLRVDRWYFQRFTEWSQRVRDAYATISKR